MNTKITKHSISKQIAIYSLSLFILSNIIVALGFSGIMISRLFASISEMLAMILMSVFVIISVIIGVIVFIKLRRYFGKVFDKHIQRINLES
jgi:hypothetical protein